MKKSALYGVQAELSPRWSEFAGWQMPLAYSSQIEEHHAVRRDSGMFDVSHMQVVDVKGEDARRFLSYALANDIDKITLPGRALYSCLLNHEAGVIDDLILYFLSEQYYRLVVNAACAKKDIDWLETIKNEKDFEVQISPVDGIAMLAIQGPLALARVASVVSAPKIDMIAQLKPFGVGSIEGWTVARTGYTGEDGLEMIIPVDQAQKAWLDFYEAGIRPCGLGARDTLRLEAGLNLYGQDMDETTHPFESNLGWTVALENFNGHREFVGRSAIDKMQSKPIERELIGLIINEKAVLRRGQKVILKPSGEGEITSGTFSPTLEASIGFARIPVCNAQHVTVLIRNKPVVAQVVRGPFVRHGEKTKAIKEILP